MMCHVCSEHHVTGEKRTKNITTSIYSFIRKAEMYEAPAVSSVSLRLQHLSH